MTRLTNVPSKRVPKKSILFKDGDGNYRTTYNGRIYFKGNRKFVLWQGMVCWLRNAYRGHFVVWTMESPQTALAGLQ